MLSAAEFPFAFYAIAAFVFGLLVGSFLNVVIWRVPRGESIAFPGSHCGSCGAPVRPYDNIPLLSYAMLGGKCRACKAKISFIYPAVELLTGLLFLAVMYKSGPTWVTIAEMIFVAVLVSLTFIDARHQLLPNVITYPAFLFSLAAITALAGWGSWFGASVDDVAYLRFFYPPSDHHPDVFNSGGCGAVLLALAVPALYLIDWLDDILFGKYFEQNEEEENHASSHEMEDELNIQRRHNRIILATGIAGLLLAIVWAIEGYRIATSGVIGVIDINGDAYKLAYINLLRACLGALVGGGIIWLLRTAYFLTRGSEGMGLGDVKLMAVIGAFLGWQQSILVIIIGSLAGSVVGIILARKSADGMRTALPFGVFLGPAAILALFFGQSIVQWYAGNFR